MAAACSPASSPWNFPLAIFTGQIAAALAAGNAVIAKPAEQTPLIAARAVRLLHEAGVPGDVLHLLPGDGQGRCAAGRRSRASRASPSPARPRPARAINRALASRHGPIAPFIAETGGLNAMIVDSSALARAGGGATCCSPAFNSAGQRCSALRILFVQEDVADKIITMLAGAMAELRHRRSGADRDRCRPGDRRGGARRLAAPRGDHGPRRAS